MLPRMIGARAAGRYVLELVWDDGETSVVEVRPMIERGGLFKPLADLALFAQVALDHSGRFIMWPSGLDLCADALRIAGMPARA